MQLPDSMDWTLGLPARQQWGHLKGPPPSSILITGCSSGIGMDAALRLAGLGWRVIGTCRGEPPHVLAAAGVRVIQLDLECPASVIAAAAQIQLIEPKPLGAVFLNAGFAIAGAIEDLPLGAWHAQFQVNLFSQVDLASRLIRAGHLASGGRLVWCGSVLGIVPMPMRGAYAASKAAMAAVADVQRLELAHKGIHVSLIEPGPILTSFRANSLAALHRWVALESSGYLPAYAATISRLRKVGAASAGTLGADAVTGALIACLSARRPAARYRVTRNTTLVETLRRLLPRRWLESFVRRAAGGELMPVPKTSRSGSAVSESADRGDAEQAGQGGAASVQPPTASWPRAEARSTGSHVQPRRSET